MSKKTIAIYNSLDKLGSLQKRLELLEKGKAEKDFSGEIAESKELSDISFEFNQEIKTLRFWIDSLYKYNGKSTSISKKNASAENGKKGGRPPKEISLIKKQITALKTEVIPELDHKIIMADSNEELESLKSEREKANDKLFVCEKKLKNWLSNKK